MPSYYCRKATCPTLLKSRGYCDKHKHLDVTPDEKRQRDKLYGETRDKEAKAFWDSAIWKATRANKLALTPYCELCPRRSAEEAHHIVGVRESKELRLVMSNLMSVCGTCHKRLEARLRHRRRRAVTE